MTVGPPPPMCPTVDEVDRVVDTASRAVRAAIDIIEDGPADVHTVASLARAVHVSRRSLERQFRQSIGISPWRFVKLTRLHRAHVILRQARPDRVAVSEVAHRVGMTHSHFTTAYQVQFGETPYETLRHRDNHAAGLETHPDPWLRRTAS